MEFWIGLAIVLAVAYWQPFSFVFAFMWILTNYTEIGQLLLMRQIVDSMLEPFLPSFLVVTSEEHYAAWEDGIIGYIFMTAQFCMAGFLFLLGLIFGKDNIDDLQSGWEQ